MKRTFTNNAPFLMIFLLVFTVSFLSMKSAKNAKINHDSSRDVAMNLVNEQLNVQGEMHLFPSHQNIIPYNPAVGKTFIGFKEALGFKESGGDYFKVNEFGYLGKYQFGAGTLKLIGVYNTSDFLKNPELQEKAFVANAERNKWILRKDIKRFDGFVINGVKITESGILAAAHLAGAGNVKKYLRSNGQIGFSDAFGTSISYYLRKFSGYDTAKIVANKKAKVSQTV